MVADWIHGSGVNSPAELNKTWDEIDPSLQSLNITFKYQRDILIVTKNYPLENKNFDTPRVNFNKRKNNKKKNKSLIDTVQEKNESSPPR